MTIRSDNKTTIFKILQKLDIRIAVAHILGKDNGEVDALSRMEVTGDYALNWDSFRTGISMLGPWPVVGLFAHNRNNKLQRFVAIEGPLAAGVESFEALSSDWGTEYAYIFPPVQLIPRVLQKINEDRAKAIVVVPQWP
jgi:hypothetical protein